jgi:hypothetical protein
MLNLLWAVAVILFVLWLLGFALHFTLGGFIHVLLVLAIIAVLFGLSRAAGSSEGRHVPEEQPDVAYEWSLLVRQGIAFR